LLSNFCVTAPKTDFEILGPLSAEVTEAVNDNEGCFSTVSIGGDANVGVGGPCEWALLTVGIGKVKSFAGVILFCPISSDNTRLGALPLKEDAGGFSLFKVICDIDLFDVIPSGKEYSTSDGEGSKRSRSAGTFFCRETSSSKHMALSSLCFISSVFSFCEGTNMSSCFSILAAISADCSGA